MKLAEFSKGTIYLDTNLLYMYLRTDPVYLPVLKTFLQRIIHGEIEAFVSVPVLDELYYRLLLGSIKDTTSGNPLDVLRNNLVGALQSHGSAVATSIRRLITLPHFHLVGVEAIDGETMLDNIMQHALLPRDALHVAILQRLSLTAIASDDADFDRVSGLARHWLINPPAEQITSS